MRNTAPFLGLLLAALAAAPAQAQQVSGADHGNPVIESRLDVLVASHETVADRQRDQVASFLLRADVQEVARSRGIEMERVQAAAGTMSNTQLNEVASLVSTLAPVQNGGMGTITVSVVAIIIVLLVLILVT